MYARSIKQFLFSHKKLVAIILLLAIISVVCVPRACYSLGKIREDNYEVVWSAASKDPVPGKFCYLLLPSRSSIHLLREDESESSVVLDRAFVCNQEELVDARKLKVWSGTTELQVPIREVTFIPIYVSVAQAIDRWKALVKQWGTLTDWPEVDVHFQVIGSDKYRVELLLVGRGGDVDKFVYIADRNGATPEKWYIFRAKKFVLR